MATPHQIPLVSSSMHSPMKSSSAATVNGIGFWKNLTRNFKSPLQGFLDLMDNAVDAVGDTDYISIDSDNDTGVVLINSSQEEIPDLATILELFSSNKGNTSQIGENGIGLKQGCACLSDLSFVCTKSNGNFQLGIIAKDLQTEDEIHMPSLAIQDPTQIQEEIYAWLEDNQFIQRAVEQYGQNDDLKDAIHRLEQNFRTLEQKEYQHVFGLFLHKVKQGERDGAYRAKTLLDQIAVDLPQRYLHIPEHVKVLVRNQQIRFDYFQSRLVEMAQFSLFVNPKVPLQQDPDWKLGLAFPNDAPINQVPFRLYLGFDALRVNIKKKGEAKEKDDSPTPNFYIFSRKSGRQITKKNDIRTYLPSMSAGGTKFCQGLTILLDDCETALPLNPTKQDLAFAEHSTGAIYEKNLYMWISSAMRCYYNRYFDMFGESKADLSSAIRETVADIRSMNPNVIHKPLHQSLYGTFEDYVSSVRGECIRLKEGRLSRYIPGPDVLFKVRKPHNPVKKESKKRKAETVEMTEQQVVPSTIATGQLVVPFSPVTQQQQPIAKRDLKLMMDPMAAKKYETMKMKKRAAEEKARALQEQLAAAQKEIASLQEASSSPMVDSDHKLAIADLREQLIEKEQKAQAVELNAKKEVKEMKGRLQETEADCVKKLEELRGQLKQTQADCETKLKELRCQHRLEKQDMEDEIVGLKARADYFKKKRNELLEDLEECGVAEDPEED